MGFFGGVVLFGAFYVPDPLLASIAMGLAGALVTLAVLIRFLNVRHANARKHLYKTVSGFVENDASPSFLSDREGEVQYQNKAARERFVDQQGKALGGYMSEVFANPSAVLFRLQNKAVALGAAREDIVTRRGQIRLSVHQVGEEGFLWRIEDIADRPPGSRGADSLSLPMLTAGKSGAILFMNEAFRRLVGARVKSLDRIFQDLPLRSGEIHRVDCKDGSILARVAEVEGPGGRREIYLIPDSPDVPVETGLTWDVFENLPVALLKLDGEGTIEASNRSARELFDRPVAPGILLSELVEGLGRAVSDWTSETLKGRGVPHSEVLRVKGADQEKFLQITLNRMMEGEKPILIAVLSDATELKTLEAQFVQSQKMQAIGQLAGGVAHDFNNLLTAISGHCDLLLLRHDQGDPDYGDLVQINQNANRAASLVGQLLAFSRKQNLQPEIMDVRDTLSDLTHLLNRLVGEKVTLSLTHDPGLPAIRADKRQLEQVLMNLVVNARDAMPEGGEISIETQTRVLSEALKRDRAVVPVGRYVSVTVTDQGVGIPADMLAKIFEPFYTTKRTGEGTGLGLSTAYGIVKQTGGYIFVDSVQGSGTTFTLYFPAHDRVLEVPAIAEAVRTAVPGGSGEGVVLLVEDEAPVRAFAARALRLRGYTVIEAECAEEALSLLEDSDLEVDLFVTDVIMPGLDGPSWVREALKKRPGVKVVFVSGYAEESFTDDQARIPNSVFLPKPFSLNQLTATVQDQLH